VTGGHRTRLQVVGVVVLSVSFALLAHAALVDGIPPTAGAVLSLVPAALLAWWLVIRTQHRIVAAVALAALAAGLWLGWPHLERHFPDVLFIQHAGINLVLGTVFGRTLFGGREPLVTTFARLVHGTLPPEVERYSRRVTVAWTLFFAVLFAASCALYLAKQQAAWSFLATIASPVLIATMFVAEYFVRHRVLPHWERVGILGGIRAFARHFQSARFEAPR
jgi:uncharacterized membrane protein